MKKKILAILKSKEEKRNALGEGAKTTEDIKELRSINSEIETLNNEIAELRSIADSIPDDEGNEGEEKRSATPVGGFNPLATYGLSGTDKRSSEEKDMEYRKAFMDYVLGGREIPQELRANVTTLTTDIGAIIPNTLMNKIIEKLKFYGNIFSRVTITNIKGGVTIPVASAKPTASWVGEGVVADKQKKEVKGTVTFAYHKLQCRVAVSLEADTTSLSIFESNVIDNVYEAMVIAIEEAIINGTGVKQPLGITKDTTIPAAQKIVVKPSELKTWAKWSKVFAKLPLSKRNGAVLILNSETYEGDILGMVDENGQPVARVTYGLDGGETYRFKGKEVVQVEDHLPSFDAAATGAVFGIIVNLKDYMVNSNLQMTIKRYFDEDTDEYITKSTALLDGKLADTQGVLLLTKGTDV